MSLKEKVITSILWIGSTKALGQVSSILITIVLARLLTPKDFGLMGLALVFMMFTEFFYELGFGAYIIYKEDLQKADLDTCFWFSVTTGFLLASLTVLIAPLIGLFFETEQLTIIIRVISINFILRSLGTVPLNLLTKEFEFKKRSCIEFGTDLLSGIVAVGLAYKGFGVWSLVSRSIFRAFVFTGLLFVWHSWRPGLLFSIRKLREIIRYGLPVTGSRLLWYISANSDYVIVGKFLGDHALGIYRMAYLLSRKPLERIWIIVGDLALPLFSKIKNEEEKLQEAFMKFLKYISMVVFPANTGLILIAQNGIPILLGSKWIAIILPFQLLCALGIIKTLDITVNPLFNACGKPDYGFKFDLLSCFVLPVAFLIGAEFGLKGVCIAWLTGYPLIIMVKLYYSLRELNLSLGRYLRNFMDTAAGSVLMALIILLLQGTLLYSLKPLHQVVWSCLAGVASYLSIMFFISSDFRSALKELLSMMKKRMEERKTA